MMPFQAYIDDSGCQPNQPLFVLAGFIASAEQWAKFSTAWQAVLEIPPKLDYFRMHEAFALKGEFSEEKGWDAEKCEERLLLLASVIRDHVLVRVSVSIEHTLFEKYIRSLPAPERRLANDTPYMMLFTEIITTTALIAPRLGMNEPCDFIFDEQDAYMEEAYDWWPVYRNLLASSLKPETGQFIGSRPIFRDDKAFLPLQAADMYAWQVRRNFIENRNLYMAPHAALRRLQFIPEIHRGLGELELGRTHAHLLKEKEAYIARNPNVPLVGAGRGARRLSKKKRKESSGGASKAGAKK